MERILSRALVAWVDFARRRARAVVIGVSLATVALGAFTVLTLGVNTHHTAILSDDMPFWRDYHEFAEVFPILDESLLVVIDADTVEIAQGAANALAARLATEPERYRDVYVPGGDPFFERTGLLYLEIEELEDLSDQLATVQPLLAQIVEDGSLARVAQVLEEGVEYARTDPDAPFDLTLVFDSLTRAVEAVLQGNPRPISWMELVLRRKMPGDSARRLIVLEPVFDFDRLLPGRRAILGVRDAAAELGLTPEQGVTVRVTGNVALNTEEMVTVARGALLGIAFSLAAVGVLLWTALRSTHLVVSAVLTLLVSLIWTAAAAAAVVGHVNVVSVAFAVLVIGLGVDFGIHFCMRYAELLRGDTAHKEALAETTRSVGGSLVLCAFTTAMGFFVFVPTDYKAVGELGLIGGMGMGMSLVVTLTLLPALLTVWRERHPGTAWSGVQWFERVVITASAHHPRTVRAVAVLLALASVALLPRLHFDHNVSRMRDPSTESVQAFDELLDESETSPWTMDVMAPDLVTAIATAERLSGLDVVERAVTLQDYVPTDQPEKLEILAELGYFVPQPRLPQRAAPPAPVEDQIATLRALRETMGAPWLREGDSERAASADRAIRHLDRFLARLETLDPDAEAEVVARFEHSLTGALPGQINRLWRALDAQEVGLEDLPPVLSARMLDPEQGRARIEVLPREDLSDNEAHTRFVDDVRGVVPEATGSAVTLLEFGRAVVRSFRQALAYAVVAVGLLLWLLWRRVSDMLLVLAPLILAGLLTAGTAAVFGLAFNFANVIVLPLLLGIGVDSGIHLVHRHRVTIETLGHAEAPERELLGTSTAQAVFFSALTTMASFGTLAFSAHRGFASLGLLLIIGVAYTLLCNLIVLPALLALRSPEADA
jgi:hopanoid biosynthesis associated RND transporter like protein HpnN